MALLLMTVLTSPHTDAGVFGDGDPLNGPEDGRKSISVGGHRPPASDWYRGTGTLVCDGAVRGSATLLDVSSIMPGLDGVVLATAAHVLFDLESQTAWTECRFAFMGLAQLPGYSAVLDERYQLLGDFRPENAPAAVHSGSGDWAFLWLGPDWSPPPPWLAFPPGEPMNPDAQAQGGLIGSSEASLGMVAWDHSRGEVSVITGCHAVMSTSHDIGGGAWHGQLLDNCDSDLGASGGGLIVHDGMHSRLVAIRGGSHWDAQLWPADQYPDGPPAGSHWDPNGFTNYARTLDPSILTVLSDWLRGLPGS